MGAIEYWVCVCVWVRVLNIFVFGFPKTERSIKKNRDGIKLVI